MRLPVFAGGYFFVFGRPTLRKIWSRWLAGLDSFRQIRGTFDGVDSSLGEGVMGGLAGGKCRGQQPIKVDVNLVNVAFTARDGQGKLVENLKREDVELLEDAVPQKIEFFARST